MRGQPEKMRNMVRIKIKGKAGRLHSHDCTMAEKEYYSLPPLPYTTNSTAELMPTGHEETLNSRAHIKFNGWPRFNLYADCKEPVYSAPRLPFKANAAPEARPNVYAESSLDCVPPIEHWGRQRLNPYADYKEPACSAPPVLPSLSTSNYLSRQPELDFSAHEVSRDSSAHSTSSLLATEGPKEFKSTTRPTPFQHSQHQLYLPWGLHKQLGGISTEE